MPLTEDAVLRPNPGYLPAILDAECERALSEWALGKEGRIATRLRVAPVVGGESNSIFAAVATGRPPVALRNAAAPVQVAHVDDVARALLIAIEQSLPGVYNVASDGWLAAEDANALHPRRHLPALPPEAAARMLQVLWSSGLGDAPPSVVPYLAFPWVIANDRMKDAGWNPELSNEEAILLATPAPRGQPVAVDRGRGCVLRRRGGCGLGALRAFEVRGAPVVPLGREVADPHLLVLLHRPQAGSTRRRRSRCGSRRSSPRSRGRCGRAPS